MKKLRIVLLTVAVILIAAGAAFATNSSKDAVGQSEPGYYFDSSTNRCVETDDRCSPTGYQYCTWSENPDIQLYRKTSTTVCNVVLYKN
jgi:hypothetical protein